MVTASPLLLLLDSILSQDEARTSQALAQIQAIVPLMKPWSEDNPMRSAVALESIVQTLMKHQPQLAQIASKHDSSLPLHFAASIGNIRVAHLLLEQFRDAASTPNSKGKIPLHYAAREGRTDMVIFMLQRVPRTASILSKKGKLALHFAAGDGHVEVVRALLGTHPKGAILPSRKGKVAIHFAARWGNLTIAKDLVGVSPDCVSMLDYDGSLPLHDACREGQLEMAKFLVERHPQGLSHENIRGETPLFPAVRSGNMDLCVYLLKAWPKGGKHVLQRICEEDNVQNWEKELLDLCLRGAVNNVTDYALAQDTAAAAQQPWSEDETHTSDPSSECSATPPPADPVKPSSDDPATLPLADPVLTPILDITIPRSKSPILEEGGSRNKKRYNTGSDDGSHKRARRGSCAEDDPLSSLEAATSHPLFFQIHAALECGATAPVLECVLDRHSDQQLQAMDDLGKLPLHVAVEHCNQNVNLVVDRIWKPYKEACSQRDFLGRLPLHLALQHRADCRIVQVLLESNPCSGVEHCEMVDTRFIDKLPLEMATESDCDLSTVYMLVRGDPSVINYWQPRHPVTRITNFY
jgi:ankyrin repeat protein